MVSRCWWLLALAGCAEDAALTELVLSADSNVRLDEITFELSAEGVPMRSATAARTGKGASVVSIVREDAPLGPITVVARGMVQNREVLHRTHLVEFVPGQSLLVPLDLYQRCVNALCTGAQTCAADGCTAQKLSQLQAWTGTAPSLASSGVDPTLTQCGANLVDLGSDPAHCGACDKGCWIWQNCAAGACVRK